MNIEKAHLCTEYLDRHLVPKNRRPIAWSEDTRGGIVSRIFISADWFDDWASWKQQADIARDAYTLQFDVFDQCFVKGGNAYPLSSEPRYFLEKSIVFPSGFTVWVNSMCPSRTEYERTVAEARERIKVYKQPLDGVRVAEFGAPLPLLPIPSGEFQAEPVNSDVAELLASL